MEAALYCHRFSIIFLYLTVPVLVHYLMLLTHVKRSTFRIPLVMALYLPWILLCLKNIFIGGIVKGFEKIDGTWFEIIKPLNFWDIAYLSLYCLYFLGSILLLIKLKIEAKILKEKKMARTMLTGFILSFSLVTLIQFIQPFIFKRVLIPGMPHISFLFFSVSIWYSIVRYGFMGKTPAFIESNPLYRKLSQRERMILAPLCEGLTYREIGRILNISEGTIKKHVENIYRKTGIKRKVELISEMYSREPRAFK